MNVSLTGYNIELRRKVGKFEVQGDPSGFVDFYLVFGTCSSDVGFILLRQSGKISMLCRNVGNMEELDN